MCAFALSGSMNGSNTTFDERRAPRTRAMNESHQFVRVDFYRFKALERFALHIRHFNILVGPNNAGKSTILAAFRILASALRTAS